MPEDGPGRREPEESGGAGLARRVWRLPFRAKVRLASSLLRDPRVPWTAKAALPLAVLYLAMPVDLVPDFIPGLGQLDDVVVAAGTLWLLRRLAPPGLLEELVGRLEGRAADAGGRSG